MIKSSKDLVGEIDQTIDQLIENAKVLHMISSETLYEEEMLALAKTKESLIAHLIHMDEILRKKDQGFKQEPLSHSHIQEKLSKESYIKKMLEKKEELCKPKIHKRKALKSY